MVRKHQRILILGGTGFVGMQLCARLARAGREVTVLTRRDGQRGDLWVLPKLRVVEANVYDPDVLTHELRNHDAAINLVGILNESGRDGSGFRRAHVELTETLIRACRKAGVQRYLHMSALGAGEGRSHYQTTKGEAEHIALAAGKKDLRVTVFKPSVIFGPGDSFILRFAKLLRWFWVLPLACPQARMQPVFVGNVAEAIIRCLDNPATFGKSYQLCGPNTYTLQELVRYTAERMNKRRLIIPLPNWASKLQGWVCDFVPGKPFSTDNYRSLQTDNVCSRNGLKALGIQASSLEAVVPGYLGTNQRQHRIGLARKRGIANG